MQSITEIKYLRVSPKKIREFGAAVSGLNPDEAINRLLYYRNPGAKLLASAIKSARSNAVNNLKQNAPDLCIKAIEILKGPFFKRWQPVSRGMAHQIKKRTSHIKIKLEDQKNLKSGIKEKKAKVETKERSQSGTQS